MGEKKGKEEDEREVNPVFVNPERLTEIGKPIGHFISIINKNAICFFKIMVIQGSVFYL